jgi:hypothetical protein
MCRKITNGKATMLSCVGSKHLLQRNLALVLTDAALASVTSTGLLGRWVILALKAEQAYPAYRVVSRIVLSFAIIGIAAGQSSLAAASLFFKCCLGLWSSYLRETCHNAQLEIHVMTF